jgi:DNA (cytosine-5)-methyltransferase 1
MAVESVFNADVKWTCEIDPAASKVLAARYPSAPNLGDIAAVKWKSVAPVDILCGGFPCQDISVAGLREGIAPGTRSGLWSEFVKAIAALRPSIVVIENVRGLLSARANRNLELADPAMGEAGSGLVLRAAGAVCGDLADAGYDAIWKCHKASDVGAPHRRERVFILAYNKHGGKLLNSMGRFYRDVNIRQDFAVKLMPTPTTQDSANNGGPAQHKRNTKPLNVEATLMCKMLPTPRATDPGGTDSRSSDGYRPQLGQSVRDIEIDWGEFAPAILRWESLTGQAPSPVELSDGRPRLAPEFAEWMMGWPTGWVTGVEGVTRRQMLRIIGNGVVPQQAATAMRELITLRYKVLHGQERDAYIL